MTAGPLRVLIAAGLALGGGCVADFAVGEGDETEGTLTGGTGGDASASSVTLSGGASNSGTSGVSTSTSTTTDSTTNPVTTEPPTTTMEPTTEAPTTDPPMTDSSSTGTPLTCAELGYEDCLAEDPCLWVGPMADGVCEDDPCFDFKDTCLGMNAKMCLAAESCTFWDVGDDCFHHECWPCHEIEGEAECNEIEPCIWNGEELACVHVT